MRELFNAWDAREEGVVGPHDMAAFMKVYEGIGDAEAEVFPHSGTVHRDSTVGL